MESAIFDTSVTYIENKNIDRDKWDKCIDNATNGLIYAYTFYLDAMAKHWDGLVMNDYEAVMPVTWNKKYGVYYLYQPFLCASLGVFGNNITSEILLGFLNKISKRFKYWDIYLNKDNFFTRQGFNTYSRTNHILNLNNSYTLLFRKYRTSYKQILNKSTYQNLTLRRNIPVEQPVKLAQKQLSSVAKIPDKDFKKFINLYNTFKDKLKAKTYGVFHNDELMASGVFFFSNNRAYYILAGNHPKGRSFAASHLVIDTFIKEHAGNNLILDFEGSDVKDISFFFKGFGAEEEIYPGLRYNNLPFYIRWFKK